MAKLNTYVHAVERDADGKQTGRAATFGPADALPDWAIAAITNPDVWAEAPAIEAAHQGGSETEDAHQLVQPPTPEAGSQDSGPPPRSGPGAGKERWAAYAAQHGVEVDEDAKRDDIIAALDEAGVPTA